MDVHAEDTVLDQVEFAGVVGCVDALAEAFGDAAAAFGLLGGAERLRLGQVPLGLRHDNLVPEGVLGIEALEEVDHLEQNAHGEGARTAGRIENATAIEGLDQRAALGVVERHILFVRCEERLDAVGKWSRRRWRRHSCLRAPGRQECLPHLSHLGQQVGFKALVHHVVDDLARGVEGAALFAGRLPRLRIVGAEQVLEDLAEQFGIERHIGIVGRVLVHREVVAGKEGDESLVVEEEVVGDVSHALFVAAESVLVVLAFVQALEQPAVEEGDRAEPFDDLVGRAGELIAIAVEQFDAEVFLVLLK